jgi:hypothetical protein
MLLLLLPLLLLPLLLLPLLLLPLLLLPLLLLLLQVPQAGVFCTEAIRHHQPQLPPVHNNRWGSAVSEPSIITRDDAELFLDWLFQGPFN